MKKRNKPFVLVTVLILMVGAVAFVNFPKDALAGSHGPGDGHDHGKEEAPQTGKDVDVPDQKSIADSVAGSIDKKDDMRSQMQSRRPGGPDAGPQEPMLKVNKPSAYKPQPSESSTSTQWYSDETLKEIPKEQPKKK